MVGHPSEMMLSSRSGIAPGYPDTTLSKKAESWQTS